MVKAKSSAVGNADWPSFFNLLIQCILALGPIGFGMVASWVFGREYSDRVVKDLLALPVSRINIVIAKFIVIIIWSAFLALTFFVIAFLTGLAVHIPGWSAGNALHAFFVFTCSSILTLLLCTPVAFIASASRGYLLPIGFAFITLILMNIVAIGLPNVLPYFPWAFPALCSGTVGQSALQPCAMSYFIYGITVILGYLCTAAWWRFADQT
jgi:ABC-2 type transport system permease protein